MGRERCGQGGAWAEEPSGCQHPWGSPKEPPQQPCGVPVSELGSFQPEGTWQVTVSINRLYCSVHMHTHTLGPRGGPRSSAAPHKAGSLGTSSQQDLTHLQQKQVVRRDCCPPPALDGASSPGSHTSVCPHSPEKPQCSPTPHL